MRIIGIRSVTLCIALPTLALLLASGCSGTRPADLGVVEGALRACPDSPNCVSTAGPDEQHHFEAVPFEGTASAALERMKQVIEAQSRSQIVTATDDYLHAEFTSLLIRYVDDVEVHAPAQSDALQLRSASRVGHSDLGANRRRLEQLRDAFLAP